VKGLPPLARLALTGGKTDTVEGFFPLRDFHYRIPLGINDLKYKRKVKSMDINMSHLISNKEERLFKSYVREVPDFPKKGVLFRDITPLLNDPAIFKKVIHRMCEPVDAKSVDRIAGIESRGFILGGAMALNWNVGFVPIRKAGKLPRDTHKESYGLEYGQSIIEIHRDAFAPRQTESSPCVQGLTSPCVQGLGSNVILVDDVLATGGTARAACKLIEKCGAKVIACIFLIELTGLKGIRKLDKYNVFSLLKY